LNVKFHVCCSERGLKIKTSRIETRVGMAGLVLLFAGMALAPAIPQAAEPASADVFGSQMMTEAERFEHHERMRNVRTDDERRRIRAEHQERMTERAKERGITLPDEPPMDGRDRGMGGAVGPSPGPGSGGGRGGGR
jgi:hypothetical protein